MAFIFQPPCGAVWCGLKSYNCAVRYNLLARRAREQHQVDAHGYVPEGGVGAQCAVQARSQV